MNKNFFPAWLAYWLVIFLLPVHSIYPATDEAFALQLFFVAIVFFGYVITYFFLGEPALPVAGFADLRKTSVLVNISLVMSMIGIVFLVFDKLFIQGIDYSEGLAVAREEWRRAGEDRDGGVSSIFSVLGYLLGSSYYVAIVLAVTQVNVLGSSKRIKILLASFLLLMLNSAISGGRSNVLLVAACIFGAMASRRDLNFRQLFPHKIQWWLMLMTVGLSGIYILFIFYQRADASDMSAQNYALDFLPYLGLELDAWFFDLMDGGVIGSLLAMIVLAVSYVTHSFATVAAIVNTPSEDKVVIFLHFWGLLGRIGLLDMPDGEWFLAGRFSSVPGALWYQMGGIGFVAVSFLLGATSAVVKAWTARQPDRLLPLGAFVMIEAVLLLSPALFAADFLSFPFVVVSFLLLAVIDFYFRINKG
jgi:hypothetical protein